MNPHENLVHVGKVGGGTIYDVIGCHTFLEEKASVPYEHDTPLQIITYFYGPGESQFFSVHFGILSHVYSVVDAIGKEKLCLRD